MTQEELDNEAHKHLNALQSLEAAGIITYKAKKDLSSKVKAWWYDRKQEIETEIQV